MPFNKVMFVKTRSELLSQHGSIDSERKTRTRLSNLDSEEKCGLDYKISPGNLHTRARMRAQAHNNDDHKAQRRFLNCKLSYPVVFIVYRMITAQVHQVHSDTYGDR